MKRYFVRASLAIVIAWCLSPTGAARAQASAWCPPAGTTIKGTNDQGAYTRVAKGADPGDSAVCVSVLNGPGAGIDNGKTIHRLYGWYDLDHYSRTPATTTDMHRGLGAILSGQTSKTAFEMTSSQNGTRYNWSGTENWERVGQATLSIGGRPTAVVMLREAFKGGASSGYDGFWNLWYDPALHVFVKGEHHAAGGPINNTFTVLSVSRP